MINNNNGSNNHDNSDVIIKLVKNAKSKYFLLPGLSRKRMDLFKIKKKKRKSAFYFLIKVRNLNLY